jgi:hypothetical protein
LHRTSPQPGDKVEQGRDDVLRYWLLFDASSKDGGDEHIVNFVYGGLGQTMAIENVVVGREENGRTEERTFDKALDLNTNSVQTSLGADTNCGRSRALSNSSAPRHYMILSLLCSLFCN